VAGLEWYRCDRLKPATRIPLQPNHIQHTSNQEQYDQCGVIIEMSQAPDDGCINVRNMLSIEELK